jgi:ABC-2 type transport system ATP-binding protein
MSESEAVLDIKGLFHSFRKHVALKSVTFQVDRNSIHGFVGPNGAGKTTTLKLVSTLLKPQGTAKIKVFGYDVGKDYKEVRRRIGFMPDHFSMYKQMTVFEYLDFFAAAYGLKLEERDKVIGDLLELTDMSGRKDSLIKGLSRGMQQRVNLARVLVHDPDLLLLDEPASGLDPRARIELMEILRELRNMGKTIFISSHILSELADLCDSVTILDVGEVKYTGKMKNLLSHNRGSTVTYRLILREPHEELDKLLIDIKGVEEVNTDPDFKGFRLTIDEEVGQQNSILKKVIEVNADIVEFREETKHLNQAFMDLTQAGVRS